MSGRGTRVRRRLLGRWLLLVMLGATIPAAAATVPPIAAAGPVDNCRPEGGLAFVCGTGAVEELAAVPGTPWLIAGALNIGAPASFHLIDRATRQARPLALDRVIRNAPGGACPAPPDVRRWSIDGLALAPAGPGRWQVYAANHGDRNAVELLALSAGSKPRLRWTGCVPMPAHTLPNAIAAVPGGFVVTSFYDPNDGSAWRRLARRDAVSSVWRWRGSRRLERLATGPLSGANGIVLSRDGHTLFVSAWAERALVVLDLVTGTRRRIAVPFLPDNLHLDRNGKLLVAGQVTNVAAIAACTAQCVQPWIVSNVDPNTGSSHMLLTGPGTPAVNYICGAQRIGGELWLTLRGSPRVGLLP